MTLSRPAPGEKQDCCQRDTNYLRFRQTRLQYLLIRSNMGHGAQATRRALIDKVHDCVSQTNAMTTLATDVREANNKLAEQTGVDVRRLETRLDTLSAWCKRLEADLAIEQRFRRLTRSELPQLNIEHAAFSGMTFFQRLRWLVTGRWPRPLRPGEGLLAVTAGTPSSVAVAGIACADTLAVLTPEKLTQRLVDESNAYGRMSAGMAPRPLP
jgi:hypothetical protein